MSKVGKIGSVTDPGSPDSPCGVVTVSVTDKWDIEVSIKNDDGNMARVVLTVDLGPNSPSSFAGLLLVAERTVVELMAEANDAAIYHALRAPKNERVRTEGL